MGSGSGVGGLLMGPCTTVLGAEKSPLEKIELERTRLPVPPSTEIATPSRPLKAMVLAEAAAVPPNGVRAAQDEHAMKGVAQWAYAVLLGAYEVTFHLVAVREEYHAATEVVGGELRERDFLGSSA
jgi:hypothetical protein